MSPRPGDLKDNQICLSCLLEVANASPRELWNSLLEYVLSVLSMRMPAKGQRVWLESFDIASPGSR